jgi:hypothetical protein
VVSDESRKARESVRERESSESRETVKRAEGKEVLRNLPPLPRCLSKAREAVPQAGSESGPDPTRIQRKLFFFYCYTVRHHKR